MNDRPKLKINKSEAFLAMIASPEALAASITQSFMEFSNVRNAALEEAAKVCDGVGNLADQQRRGLGVMTDYEIACAQQGRAPTAQGQIGAAIRALKSDAAPEQ